MNFQALKSIMYEPVTDRCVTATMIKCPNGDGAINGYGERKDLSPPEKPPRRHSRAQRQLARRGSADGELTVTEILKKKSKGIIFLLQEKISI